MYMMPMFAARRAALRLAAVSVEGHVKDLMGLLVDMG